MASKVSTRSKIKILKRDNPSVRLLSDAGNRMVRLNSWPLDFEAKAHSGCSHQFVTFGIVNIVDPTTAHPARSLMVASLPVDKVAQTLLPNNI